MPFAKHLTFDHALQHLRRGKKIRRAAWSLGSYIALNMDGRLHLHDKDGDAGLWNPIQPDILADDWVLM